MDVQILTHLLTIASVVVLSRWPFLRFPMDEDLSFYTYRARFADSGLKWKKDMFVMYPVCRMLLIDKLYGNAESGVLRIRLFLMAMNVCTAWAIYFAVLTLTHNPWAGMTAGVLYGFFATAPAFSAESFNFEQVYLPLLFTGLQMLWLGPDGVLPAGLCFGLAVVPKASVGIFVPAMMVPIGYQYGVTATIEFAVVSAAPLLFAHWLDWKMGYLDEEYKRQFRMRLAGTLRCSRLKQMYGSITRDIRQVIEQTLPLWVLGWPALAIVVTGTKGIWIAPFAATVVIMILCQRGFSRYHYVPLIAVLAFSCGMGVDRLMRWEGIAGYAFLAGWACLTLWTVKRLLPFYLRPLEVQSMAKYEKYDQFIYLPHLGRMLNRLIRLRGESSNRIFVWGNYTQLYHATGLPASDGYIHNCIGPWNDRVLEVYFDTVIGGLMRHHPMYLIKTLPDLDMDLLETITGLKYRLVKVVLARFPVYRLAGSKPQAQDPLRLPWQKKLRLLERLTLGEHAPGIDRTDIESGHLFRALRECRKLCRMNPYDVQGLFCLAELYERLGFMEQVESPLRQFLHLEPFHSPARFMLARLLMNQDAFQDAEEIIQEEIQRHGKTGESQYHLGLLFRSMGRLEKAVESFEQAFAAAPDHVACLLRQGECLVETGEKENARKLFNRVWERAAPPDRDWIRTRAATEMAKLDMPTVSEIETLENFYRRDPQNAELSYALASALERAGEIESARARFQGIAASSNNEHLRASAWFRLARLTPPEEREHLLEECLRLEPFHEGARKLARQQEACGVEA